MSAFLNVNEIKEKISLLGLLRNLGFSPQKVSGGEYFFLSMLREEYTASLCVNDKLGVWFDHGGAGVSGIKSGSIIDFGLAYWYPSTFPEVLKKIVEHAELNISGSQSHSEQAARKRPTEKEKKYEVRSVSESLSNDAICSYLLARGINNVANGHLYELYYSVIDSRNTRKNYFASAWPNENGGWEVRNKYFKGCLGHKGMTFLQGAVDRLGVFEGYFDFLSWKLEHPQDPASVLVLNSLSFLQAAKARSKQFRFVELYFDHDKAGISATHEFTRDVGNSADCSFNYDGFKDYNEKIVSDLKAIKKAVYMPMPFSADTGFDTLR